jgi:predicted chitinase
MKVDIKDINIEASKRITIASNSGLGTGSIDVIRHLEDSMDKFKIFNKFARIAILSVVWKESGFNIKSETPYSNTPNDRIRMIFGSRLSSMSENRLTEIKADPEAFFNRVYGNMYGNGPDDGFKYRGRGLNQLTFKANYQVIKEMILVDIVSNPDLLLTPKVAADACVAYFVNRFETVHTFDFGTLDYATLIIFRANAGWGKDISDKFHQDTLTKVRNYAKYFSYETI